jgi:flagellar protein FlaG
MKTASTGSLADPSVALTPPPQSKPEARPAETEPSTDRWEKAKEAPVVETQYSVDQATHQIVVKVMDKSNDTVIRELPSEAVRKMTETLMKLAENQVDTHS